MDDCRFPDFHSLRFLFEASVGMDGFFFFLYSFKCLWCGLILQSVLPLLCLGDGAYVGQSLDAVVWCGLVSQG